MFPRLKYGLSRPEAVVGLKGIVPERPSVSDAGELFLDSLMTLADVTAAPEVRSRAGGLAEAALRVGSNQIRHMGTLGGNVCLETRCLYYNQSHSFQFTEPCLKRAGEVCYLAPKAKRCRAVFVADTPPMLICLGAHAEIVGPGGVRRAEVKDLYTGDSLKPLALGTGEILGRVIVPPGAPRQGAAFAKFSLRGGLEFAGVSVAALLEIEEDGCTCRRARLVVGAIDGGPVRSWRVEAGLEGECLSEKRIREVCAELPGEVRPVGHHGYSAAYLRHCLAVQAWEALSSAWERAVGSSQGGPAHGRVG